MPGERQSDEDMRRPVDGGHLENRGRLLEVLEDRLVRADRVERVEDQLERWLGEVSPAQQRLIAEWGETFILSGENTLDYRKRWQRQLRAVLERRDRPGFAAALTELLVNPEALQPPALTAQRRANLDRFKALLLALDDTLSSRQRQHLKNRLGELAQDFDELSRDS